MVQRHPFTRSQTLHVCNRGKHSVLCHDVGPLRDLGAGQKACGPGFAACPTLAGAACVVGLEVLPVGKPLTGQQPFGVAFGGCLGFTFGAMLGWRW